MVNMDNLVEVMESGMEGISDQLDTIIKLLEKIETNTFSKIWFCFFIITKKDGIPKPNVYK